MSKAKVKDASTPAECVPVVTRAPLGECLGRRVKCPSCGKPADVGEARGAVVKEQPISSKFWVKLKCTGCGSRLERVVTVVDVEAAPIAEPVRRRVGEVVSHFVRCPTEGCGQQCRVNWTLDDGHVIDCPMCQRRAVSPEAVVEIIA